MILIKVPLVLLSLFSCSARAQYVSGSSPSVSPSASVSLAAGSASETDSGSACTAGNVHQVTVGKNGNQFEPSTIFAHPGDVVVFTFFPSGHSVIRTAYTGTKSSSEYSGNPCVPIEILQPGTKGFFSGNQIVEAATSGNPVTWSLNITDRNPIWFYCDAPGSCQPNGMVGAINPNSSGTFQKQQAAAISARVQLSPTGPKTPSGAVVSTHSQHSGLSGGAIAGIVIGAIAVLAIVVALCYFIGRTRAYKDELRNKPPGEQPAQSPHTAEAKFAYPSPYAVDPSGFRNTAFSGTTAAGGSPVPYEHVGSVGHSPHHGHPPGFPNMPYNITTVDDIAGPYERGAAGFYPHPPNAMGPGMMPPMRQMSPRGVPPYELEETPTSANEDGAAWNMKRYQPGGQ